MEDSVEKYGKLDSDGDVKNSDQKPDKEPAQIKIEDAFACYLCGRADFESQNDATAHEISCSGKGNANGPWKCSLCGKYDFVHCSGYGSHRVLCNHSAMKGTSLSLRPTCLEVFFLSDFNALVTESIELIEITEDDTKRFAKTQRKRTPQAGNIGIRCVYCAEKGVQPPGSMSCPDDLRGLPYNIYNMVNRHLLSSCKHIPKQVRSKMEMAKKTTTSQSMQKNRIGLPVYFKILVDKFSLTDNGMKEGIQRSSCTEIP